MHDELEARDGRKSLPQDQRSEEPEGLDAGCEEQFVMIEGAAQPTGKPRVMGLAYSGGKMNLPGWRHPVVVDLTGLHIPGQVPLLLDHRNQTSARIGMIVARIEDGSLVIEGEITSNDSDACSVVDQGKAGADWQLSIGAEVKDAELVASGRSCEVNGKPHQGPFYHIKSSVLREVSVVAVGADASTRMQVAAKFTLTGPGARAAMDRDETVRDSATASPRTGTAPAGRSHSQGDHAMKTEPEHITATAAPQEEPQPKPMPEPAGADDETKVIEPPKASPADTAKAEAERAVKAERTRVGEIQAICAGEFGEIEREAISAGWDADRTRQNVLQAIRASRPQADVNISVAPERKPAETAKVLEAALCMRAGLGGDDLMHDYGERTVEAAHKERDLSLWQLFAECATLEGHSIPRSFGNDTIRAAFSTVSLPGILNNVANKRLLKSFGMQELVAPRLCSEGELNDFKESERYRLTDVGDLEPVAPDGEIKQGGLREEKATNRLETFGKVFALTRQMIFNDDLGAFLKVPEGMGARAARKVDQLFFTRLMSNPGNLFSTAHKNYKNGADTALSGDSLAVATQMFLDQVDADGQPINVSPKFLLVPTGLKITAREILNSITFMAVGSTNKKRIPTYNALADEDLTVIASPYLSNANYDGASQAAWYLFAAPGLVDTFEIGYMRGRRTPTVEQGDTDFDTLGIKFRVFFDLGVREQDHRGVLKFEGQ